jgi:hypothetical protein
VSPQDARDRYSLIIRFYIEVIVERDYAHDALRARRLYSAPDKWIAIQQNGLMMAATILSRFWFVGSVERFAFDIERLGGVLRTLGYDIGAAEILQLNTSHELRDDESWVNPDDPIGRRLLEATRHDRALVDMLRAA